MTLVLNRNFFGTIGASYTNADDADFDNVAGTAPTYQATAKTGVMALRFPASAQSIVGNTVSSTTVYTVDLVCKLSGAVTTTGEVHQIRGAARGAAIKFTSANKLQIVNNDGTAVLATTTASLPTATEFRVRVTYNGTAVTAGFFPDTTSTTATETIGPVTVTASTTITSQRMGTITATGFGTGVTLDISWPTGENTTSIPGPRVYPVYGTSAQSLPRVTQAAAGTFTAATVSTGAVAQTLPHLTQSATGTAAAPTFTGTTAQTLPHVTQAASGTRTVPSFTGNSAQTLPRLTMAASGTHTNPPGTAGSIAQTLPHVGQAATGTRTIPPRTAVAAQTLPHITQAATGTHVAPVFTASITQTMPALTQTATGTVTPPLFTASGAQTLPALTQSLTGSSNGPGVDGAITQTLPMLRQLIAGAGVRFNVEWSGAGAPHGNPYRVALTAGNPYRVRTATGSTFNAIGAP